MKQELKEKIVAFNRRRKEVEEKASDFQTLRDSEKVWNPMTTGHWPERKEHYENHDVSR